jgi:hypothetical protein
MSDQEESMNSYKHVIYLFFLFCFVSRLGAVELSPGGVYPEGTTVQSSGLGLSLSIPTGWLGTLPQGVEALILKKQGAQDTILIQAEQIDKQSIIAMMNQTIMLDAGLTLIPIGEAVEKAGVITGQYSVTGQYANSKAQIKSLIGKHGISVALIGIGFSQGEPQKTLTQLSKTITFQTPQSVPQGNTARSTGSGTPWSDYMRGRYIVFYYTGSGYHEEDHIWLCSDGTYYRSNSSGGFGGGASGASGGKASGQWRVTGTMPGEGVLTLTTGPGVYRGDTSFGSWEEQTDPSQASFTLSLQDNKLYLNGSKWFRDSNKQCQ